MNIRYPVVAGLFYPAEKIALKKEIEKCFSEAKTKAECSLVISPHAGYFYSGRVAASAIGSLPSTKQFVILGPNHHATGPEFCIADSGKWVNPFGSISIEKNLAEQLIERCPFLERSLAGHNKEHSIEVQLPFLQHKFGEFSFVPISILNKEYSEGLLRACIQLGQALANIVRKYGIGVIASSDFSHYLPLKTAKERDEMVLEKIRMLDAAGLFRTLSRIDGSVCGYGPIAVLLATAKELELKVNIIDSANSGEKSGDFTSVVTYYAIGFSR